MHRLALLLLGLCFACGPTPASTWQAEPFDQATLISNLRSYRERFVPISRAPFPSGAGDVRVQVYASPSAAGTYEDLAEGSRLPIGAQVIREVYDPSGRLLKLTSVAQGPDGYNPTVGNLWFCVADEKANIIGDATGAAQMGTMPACQGCHIAKEKTGYLFGVPSAAQ